MNYNMNSQLDDMRNEYIKLKKQRETGYSLVKNIQLLYKGIREFKAMKHGK